MSPSYTITDVGSNMTIFVPSAALVNVGTPNNDPPVVVSVSEPVATAKPIAFAGLMSNTASDAPGFAVKNSANNALISVSALAALLPDEPSASPHS